MFIISGYSKGFVAAVVGGRLWLADRLGGACTPAGSCIAGGKAVVPVSVRDAGAGLKAAPCCWLKVMMFGTGSFIVGFAYKAWKKVK